MNGIVKFATYYLPLVLKNKNRVDRYLIVLKREDGVIVSFTDLGKYIKTYSRQSVKPITSTGREKFLYVCQMLNFCLINYKIRRVNEITVDMIQEFINKYAQSNLFENDTEREFSTVSACEEAIRDFLINLCSDKSVKMPFTKTDLFRREKVYNQKSRKMVTRDVFTFEVKASGKASGKKPIFRDISTKAFNIIMRVAYEKYPCIFMICALCAFAGLRVGEALNVRREDSPLGPGIQFTFVNGLVTDVKIDLNYEKALRDDIIQPANIKVHRTQRVYPDFRDAFVHAYNMHMKLIEGRRYDSETGPLCFNQNGKAMTYHDFYYHFNKMIREDVIPLFLKSNNPDLVLMGHYMNENRYGSQIFRHFFSVKVTIKTNDPAQIQYWRGDKSIESAQTYLLNKSEIMHYLHQTKNDVFDFFMMVGRDLNE